MTPQFFSVIIPTLNEEECLPRLLEDLCEQKERDFEVIVVDGGSMDQTIARANKFRRSLTLKIIKSDQRNVSRQRNLGARAAQGQNLVFLDADVQLPSRFIEQLKHQKQTQSGDFYTTWVRADSKSVYDATIATFINIGLEIAIAVEKPFAAGYCMIISPRAFQAVGGYREDIRHAEDVDMAMRLQKKGIPLTVFRRPRVIFSLRRYRQEGRLSVIRKHAIAGLHILTKGPITQDIFHYPMGGGWYKTYRKDASRPFSWDKAEAYMKRLVKLFIE